MTDDPDTTPTDEPADDQAAGGDDRDPLTTDDGLAEVAAAGMPAVDDDREVGDLSGVPAEQRPAPSPGLELPDNGVDPLAEYARTGEEG